MLRQQPDGTSYSADNIAWVGLKKISNSLYVDIKEEDSTEQHKTTFGWRVFSISFSEYPIMFDIDWTSKVYLDHFRLLFDVVVMENIRRERAEERALLFLFNRAGFE